jgi:acetylornithine deacetylase/succinyl-diaminopimelate desuccinylase-like protein
MTKDELKITDQDIQECTTHLQNLIRIDTTNPPGNELEACKYIAKLLKKDKIDFHILEPAPGRANIVARLSGDGSEQPLLLTSHLDVVPAETKNWTTPPFSGEEKDGYIWGRGAVDMKNMSAMELCLFLKAHREKIPLKRDLILAAVADEETGCEYGSKWLVNHHSDLIRAEYALNEVGAFSLPIDKNVFYPIGVAEKGSCWLRIIAKGKSGHTSLPHDEQALANLGLAAHKLANTSLPFHSSKPARKFINSLAKHQPFPKNLVLKGIQKRFCSNFVLNKIFPDKEKARNFHSMFHNLATPTVFHSGSKINVIASKAEMLVDGRVLPEQSTDEFIKEVQSLIGRGFQIEILKAHEPIVTNHKNDFYKLLENTLVKHDPGAIPVPFLIPGYTDAKHYSRLGIKCYGFTPMKLPNDLSFGALFHGHDERIPVSSLDFGLRVLWDVIVQSST